MFRSMPRAFALLALLASSGATAQALPEARLVPPDLAVADFFGRAVALSDDGWYAVVGAPEGVDADTSDGAPESGRAYVFERTAAGWLQLAILTPSAPDSVGAFSNFGRALAVSGDGSRVFVGAPYEGAAGAAYVFAWDGGGWAEEARLDGAAACGTSTCGFGWSLAASHDGRTLAVAAPGYAVPGGGRGSLTVYRSAAGAWGPVATLVPSGGASIGAASALSADGRRAFSGSGQSRRVYVFDEGPSGWAESAFLTGSGGEPGNRFGATLAVTPDGRWLLVGADGADDVGSGSGAAYVFEHDGAAWAERARLTASDAVGQDFFGTAVALTAGAGVLVVGALGKDVGALDSGAAYVLVRAGASWEERAVVSAPDAGERDFFGDAIAVTPSGSLALFGVWASDAAADASGAAYVFALPTVLPVEQAPGRPGASQLGVTPNPARTTATVRITAPSRSAVRVALYDVFGRELVVLHDGTLAAGEHALLLDASALPSGAYVLRVSGPGLALSRVVTVAR